MPTPHLSISTLNNLIRILDFDAFFVAAAQEAARLLGADGVALIENDEFNQLHYRFFHGLPAHYQQLVSSLTFPANVGTAGQALQTNQIIFHADYASTHHAMPAFVSAGLLANLLVPLGTATEKLGVLAISWFTHQPQHAPSEDTLAAIQLLADMMYHKLYHKKMEIQLTQQAQLDTLTGLPNRRNTTAHLNQAITLSRQNDSLTAVIMLDLDDFKAINDTYGHAAGDAVLIQFADRIRHALRADDYAARLGGDEFLITLKDIPNIATLDTLLARLDADFTPAYHLHDNSLLRCPASMGVTVFPQDNHPAESLIRHADWALYQAKQHKHQRTQSWVYYTPALHKKRSKRCKDLTSDLARNLILHYQPILNVAKRELVRLEVLARLQTADTLLLPNDFLPLFDQSACAQLFFTVLDLSLTQLALWRESDFHPDIAINISPFLLRDADTVLKIVTALQQHNIAASRLTLEILEQEQVLSAPSTLHILNQLHQLGVRLALDDLGTAHSNLMRLRDLPITEIKLDQIFVKTLDSQVNDLPFALAIKELASGLNIELVAEGVETHKIRSILDALDIPLMQGYGICKPVDAAALPDALAQALNTLSYQPNKSLAASYAQHLIVETSILNLLKIAPQHLHAEHLSELTLCPFLPEFKIMPEIWQLHQRQHVLLHEMALPPSQDIATKINEYKMLGTQIRHLLTLVIANERQLEDTPLS
ncbi:MAG: EAL domain-containing protein [Sulfuriferula sp.]|nr:EAL domain-containing protein [Sulfuriferula sp.]